MSSFPWEPDRRFDLDGARSSIRAAFPGVDVTRLVPIGSGWEFDVFASADGWAFRFPRRSEYEARFDREPPVLALVRAALSSEIAVPMIELVAPPSSFFPYRFAGHRFIGGVSVEHVRPTLRDASATSIGTALGAIHAVSIDSARAAGVRARALPDAGAYEWMRRNLAGAHQLTGGNEVVRRAVQWVSAQDDPLQPLEAPVRFIHGDLSPEHLLVSATTGRLAGILDWTDAALGDPARDFVTFVTLGGWAFAERVLSHYTGATDEWFHERLEFMARFLSVMWLGEAQQNGGDVRKHIAWVERAFASPREPTPGT